MNTIIEQALQLPKKEKLELYYALQEDLEFEDGELTDEQRKQLNEITEQLDNGTIDKISEEEIIAEVEKRRKSIEDGSSEFISGDELLNRFRALQHELHSKRP